MNRVRALPFAASALSSRVIASSLLRWAALRRWADVGPAAKSLLKFVPVSSGVEFMSVRCSPQGRARNQDTWDRSHNGLDCSDAIKAVFAAVSSVSWPPRKHSEWGLKAFARLVGGARVRVHRPRQIATIPSDHERDDDHGGSTGYEDQNFDRVVRHVVCRAQEGFGGVVPLEFLTTQRKPRWLVDVSTGSACRAAGR